MNGRFNATAPMLPFMYLYFLSVSLLIAGDPFQFHFTDFCSDLRRFLVHTPGSFPALCLPLHPAFEHLSGGDVVCVSGVSRTLLSLEWGTITFQSLDILSLYLPSL